MDKKDVHLVFISFLITIRLHQESTISPYLSYFSFGCIYIIHPIASIETYAFCRWGSPALRVKGWIKREVGELETSLRSVRFSSE